MANLEIQASELKEKYLFYLESLKNLTPQKLTEMTAFIIELGDKIKALTDKQNKTDEDYDQIEQMSTELQDFIQQLATAQITLRKKEWEDTEAYYQKLKTDAAKGDEIAIEVLKDFEPIYFEMQERIKNEL